MKKRILHLSALLMFLLWANILVAQTTVTGNITDPDGLALPGATVAVKGTSIAKMSDVDGNYTIQIPAGSDILVFSFIGMETQEIPVEGKTVINCKMSYGSEVIDEVLVVGYGTMKKSDKTGAVTNVTADELNGGVNTDPIQGLQGKAAGVVITKKGGDPNAGFSVKIRGATSFTGGTEPLYVVDGVPGVDPTTIASEDIKSYDILKDASSTAIYGSRGSNGVIIITTKKGQNRKGSKVDFNSYVSFDEVANRLDLLTADEVRQYIADNNIDFTDFGASTDWQDAIFRSGMSQSHNVSISGGNESSTYYASLSRSDFEGVVIGTSKTRNVGRINLTQKALNDKLTVQTNLSQTIEDNEYLRDGILYQAFRRSPTFPITNEDGTYEENERLYGSKNPVATVNETENDRDAKRFLGNLRADLEVFSGFTLSSNFAYIRNDERNYYSVPTTAYNSVGYASQSTNDYENKLIELTASYVKEFSNTHNLNFVTGYSYQEENWNGFSAGGSNPASDYVSYNNLAMLQVLNPMDIGSYAGQAKLISFFGRAAYNYKSKYYFTGTVRRDGSSRFGPNNRWGIFPSGSFAWNIKQEGFLYDMDLISMLKLRVGYGLVGNQNIGTDLYRTLYYPSTTGIDPETGEVIVIIKGDKTPNPDLQWETNEELNIGLDYGFFNNKVSGTIEYYSKTIGNLLYPYRVPVPPNPYPTKYANEGTLNNTGIEFNVQAYLVDKTNFDWKTSFTFSTNKQELVSFDGGKYDMGEIKTGYISGYGLEGDTYTQLIKPGLELGTFYMYEYAGVAEDGAILYYTESGGVTRKTTEAEKRFVGNAMPDFEFGWSNNLKIYKNIEVNFAFRSLWGYQIYNQPKMFFGNTNILMPNGNVLQYALDEIERGVVLTDEQVISSYYLEDASFIRLDNVTIAYNVPTKKMKGVEKMRIYISSNNPWLYTEYTGIDPEISSSGLSFGIDRFDIYPKTKTLTIGANITF